MNRRFSFSIFVHLCFLVAFTAATVHAEEAEWEPVGAQDAVPTDLQGFRCWGDNELLLSTTSGFRRYLGDSSWEVFEEPGTPAREAWCAVRVFSTCGPFFTGRTDLLGHGYIERSEDGLPGEARYSSSTGRFVDIFHGRLDTNEMWACSRAGDEPGELIRSPFRGLAWELVDGHDHQDLTDILVLWGGEVYVAGDAGVAYTPDAGATWQNLSTNLPAGTIRCLWDEGPVSDFPDAKQVYVRHLLACTAQGLYTARSDDLDWNCVLEAPCLQAGRRYGQYSNYVTVLTDDQRIFWAREGEWEWMDLTGNLAGETIVRIVTARDGRLYASTANNGVWRLHSPGNPIPVPEIPRGLFMAAAPNPFNPATTLSYEVPTAGHALLTVHDLAGRRVATLLDGHVTAGPGAVTWRPQELASGIYLARLIVGTETARQRLVLLK